MAVTSHWPRPTRPISCTSLRLSATTKEWLTHRSLRVAGIPGEVPTKSRIALASAGDAIGLEHLGRRAAPRHLLRGGARLAAQAGCELRVRGQPMEGGRQAGRVAGP